MSGHNKLEAPTPRMTKRITFFAETWGELMRAVYALSERATFSSEARIEFTQAPREKDTDENIGVRVQCITVEEEVDAW